MKEEKVILVDELDQEIGLMDKMEAHEKGLLHRAFSIFLFDTKGRLLLQKRAVSKYHSGGLWTNTCCSHPRPGEKLEEAVDRRLMEEMGIACSMKHLFHFIYKKELDKGLTEHELDHVFIGRYDKEPSINTSEVEDWEYRDMDKVLSDVKQFPERYTEWFKICLEEVVQKIELKKTA